MSGDEAGKGETKAERVVLAGLAMSKAFRAYAEAKAVFIEARAAFDRALEEAEE